MKTNGVSWDYFDKFTNLIDTYMPSCGEGETMASQICTAINKLIYKWYNDGDVYDNRYALSGWCNDLSSYANWLDKYINASMLSKISEIYTEGEYENLLKELADKYLNINYLAEMAQKPKVGSIYDCDGYYKFEDDLEWEEGEDEYWYEEDEDEEKDI